MSRVTVRVLISVGLVVLAAPCAAALTFDTMANFDFVLEPGVLHGFLLGPVSPTRGYVIEVSPLQPATAAAHITAFAEPEFNAGTGTWFDVARVQLLGAPAPIKANIRVYAVTDAVIVTSFNPVLQPGVLHGFPIHFPSRLQIGHVVEVTPLEPAVGDGASIVSVAQSTSDGSSWSDVLRVSLLNASAPVHVNIRVYSDWTIPILTDFDIALQPAVPHAVSLGPSAANRGYLVAVSPVEAAAAGAYVSSSVQPEFDGAAWNDVLHVQLVNASGPVNANVRVYTVGVVPFRSFGQGHFWLRDAALPADSLVESASFTAPLDYDPLNQPVTIALSEVDVCGGVFSRFSVPAGSFTAYQGGAVLQFRGSVTDEVSGAELTALIRLVRQSGDVVRLTMNIGSADFVCLHGNDIPTITTTLSVGNTDISGRRGFTRLSNGDLFSP